ncbi:hypothetical protein, partial [Kitasatospora sp. NPDC093558]|uniref:hypothetical protein n=1 Tax=Kitasatospora sp. NPDC093558 TaxID=3155201 RepID=UPI00343A92C6
MRKNARRFTAAATVCAALIGTVGLLAPAAQAQAPARAAAAELRIQDATPPGTQVQTTTVTRPDGTQAQVAIFSTNYVTGQTIWYRSQSDPGGAYGDWSQVNGMALNFQYLLLTVAVDADGSLEVFTIGYQSSVLVRMHQSGEDGSWSAPEAFGPPSANVPRFFGAPVAFTRADGTLAFFEVFQRAGAPELYVNEQSEPGVWGSWTDLGPGPLPASVATPSTVTEAEDGTLTAVARMWNAPSMYARISEQAPGVWGPWQACATAGRRPAAARRGGAGPGRPPR